MGIIAWIAVGLTAGLLTNMLLPGKRPRGLILICLTCFTGALGGAWAASQFRAHGLAGHRSPGSPARRVHAPLGHPAARQHEAAMARQAQAEREKLRNLQSLVGIGVDKNTTEQP